MPIITIQQAAELKQSGKACLCLDLGEKKIGVAKSDTTWFLASPLKVLDSKKFSVIAEEIFHIIEENHIILLVIGLPLNADGTHNKKTQSAQQFGRNLIKLYPNASFPHKRESTFSMDPRLHGDEAVGKELNVFFEDERFSTVVSHNSLRELGLTEGQKKKFIDKLAAAQILQGFLDKIK